PPAGALEETWEGLVSKAAMAVPMPAPTGRLRAHAQRVGGVALGAAVIAAAVRMTMYGGSPPSDTAPPGRGVLPPPASSEPPASSAELSTSIDDLPSLGPPPQAPKPPASAASPASRLREESLALLEARRTLRDGDRRGALRLLDLADARFR